MCEAMALFDSIEDGNPIGSPRIVVKLVVNMTSAQTEAEKEKNEAATNGRSNNEKKNQRKPKNTIATHSASQDHKITSRCRRNVANIPNGN